MNPLDAMFGHPRGWWGRLGGWLMARSNRAIAADVLAILKVGPDDTVLDVGHGPGVGLEIASTQTAEPH